MGFKGHRDAARMMGGEPDAAFDMIMHCETPIHCYLLLLLSLLLLLLLCNVRLPADLSVPGVS